MFTLHALYTHVHVFTEWHYTSIYMYSRGHHTECAPLKLLRIFEIVISSELSQYSLTYFHLQVLLRPNPWMALVLALKWKMSIWENYSVYLNRIQCTYKKYTLFHPVSCKFAYPCVISPIGVRNKINYTPLSSSSVVITHPVLLIIGYYDVKFAICLSTPMSKYDIKKLCGQTDNIDFQESL